MNFFETFLQKKKLAESILLIDISADSIAGAYAHYEEGMSPVVVYSRRLPIETRKDETPARAMVRALNVLGADMIREGAPALARCTGSGNAAKILVSVNAPWQETVVRVEDVEQDGPFLFTKAIVAKKLDDVTAELPEDMIAEESVIGTLLNGYETHNPYGKMVRRASLIVLTSLIERHVAEDITSALKSLYHTKSIRLISGSSLRYQAMHNVFPHERDAIIVDAISRSRTSVALVRNGIFISMIQTAASVYDPAWISLITEQFPEIAKQYPLPRMIFLLVRESDTATLQKALASVNFDPLWLSDNPPKIVPIVYSHLLGMIRYLGTNSLDPGLLFMVLYHQTEESFAT